MNYASMSDMELVGHVGGIPDASELSQALADRVRLLVNEKAELETKLQSLKHQIMALELGVALDKVAAYDDLVSSQR